jgi:acyl dehydratase
MAVAVTYHYRHSEASEPMNLELLRSWKFEDQARTYREVDTMLYALGIGLGSRPTDPDELRFVTENSLCTLPTMGAVIGRLPIRECLTACGIDTSETFHAEQRSEFDRPLPAAGSVVGRGRVRGVWDKGAERGALIEFEHEIFDARTGDRYCHLRALTFARRDGGFDGGDPGPSPALDPVPDQNPEATMDFATLAQAALIYRLSGDLNPLHSDPEVAKHAGFPRPILHGYCTYGIAAWAIMSTYLDPHPNRLAALDCRFSAAVYPGETLRTEMWRSGNTIQFKTRVVERDVIALDRGRALIRP